MRTITTLLAALFVLSLSFTNASAQNNAVTWAPLEIIACNFIGDANMDDLNAVVDSWNEWMDENGNNDYMGVVLTPQYHSAALAVDVLWLGAWQSGAAMAGMEQLLTEGTDILEDFGQVLDCGSHQAFAVNNIKPPAEPDGTINPVAFTNCTINEGRIGPEGRAAIEEFSEYLTENGHGGGHWILRPAAGETADASYSFKWIRGHSSYAEMGDYFDLMFNGGGFQYLGDLTERVMSCDSPRVYNARVVRTIGTGE
jgi:hypothetical protein